MKCVNCHMPIGELPGPGGPQLTHLDGADRDAGVQCRHVHTVAVAPPSGFTAAEMSHHAELETLAVWLGLNAPTIGETLDVGAIRVDRREDRFWRLGDRGGLRGQYWIRVSREVAEAAIVAELRGDSICGHRLGNFGPCYLWGGHVERPHEYQR